MSETRSDRLRRARIEAGFTHAIDAIEKFGFPQGTYNANENGNAPFSFKKAKAYAAAYKVRAEWLYDGVEPMREPGSSSKAEEDLIRVIGIVGAASGGEVVMDTAHDRWDFVPVAPGGSHKASALEVRGGSMPGIAEDGALLYFEEQVTRPGKDMLGRVVIVATMDGRVLVKRLLRGSAKNLFDLESLLGATIEDAQLKWAAHITAIVPPYHAQKIIRRWRDAA